MLTTSAAVSRVVGIHPHVQRRVLGIGEPPAGVVQLQRGHAEVEEHAVDPRMAEVGEHRGHRVVDGVDEVDPGAVRREPGAAALQRLGIAVEADQDQPGMAGQQRLGVPAEAEGGVDHDGRTLLDRRGEECEHAVEQHRDVAALRRHNRPPP